MRECRRCDRCYNDDVETCPEEGNATKQSLPGKTLLATRYELEKRLGSGAMGQVYVARDMNLTTRKVAVKTVRPDLLSSEDLQEGEAIARFEREAKTAASIQHPNVVNVTDFGKSDDGIFYLVMEFVEGETLHHLLRREGTLSVPRMMGLMRQIAEGVEAAHTVGILHRDLKPANIFIMQKKRKGAGGDGFVKVGDFGLAKIVNEAVSEIDSKSGPASRGLIGTPEFMAPEQMQPGAVLDAKADVYALGVMAYQMLGGRTPFSGELMQLIMQKMMHAPPPLSSLRSDIPPLIEKAVMHALERDPLARSATVSDWMEELESAAETVAEDDDNDNESRVVVMAPVGAEVYVDDERQGTVGRSGRIILSSIPPGLHVLRVARTGDQDDERVIEIRLDGNEQVIQSQLKPAPSSSSTPASGSGFRSGPRSLIPTVVACTGCGSRFASGAKFCGRCGGNVFVPVLDEHPDAAPASGPRSLPTPSAGTHGPGSGQSVPGSVVGASFPCPRCNTPCVAGAKFCGKCGHNMVGASMLGVSAPGAQPASIVGVPPPGAAICRKCGTVYVAGTKFCGKCGIPIAN